MTSWALSTTFSFGKQVDRDFDSAVDKVYEVLQAEGFGVVADLDVAANAKETLDEEVRRYRVLGGCNPSLAYGALGPEDRIRLLLPCNVVIREAADGKVRVDIMDPTSLVSVTEHPDIEPLADLLMERLRHAFGAL